MSIAEQTEPAENILTVNNIEVIYNHVILVLKGVSLNVAKGGITAILGGNEHQIQHWIKTPNRHLQEEAPVEHMQTVQGIGLVVRYLDAMRGRI